MEWNDDQGSCQATFLEIADSYRTLPEDIHAIANVAGAGFLILRRRTYPAWQVKVNNKLTAVIARDDGLIEVPVQQGRVRLDVDWTTTPDVIAGRWISGLSVLALTGLCAYPFYANRRGRKAVH